MFATSWLILEPHVLLPYKPDKITRLYYIMDEICEIFTQPIMELKIISFKIITPQ